MRNEISKLHSEWFEEAVSVASSVNVIPSKPHISGRQANRANLPADSISEYFKMTITLLFLDHLISGNEPNSILML
jgi:hypothetical protein